MAESENTAELNAALAKAQGAMKHAIMDRTNPHFKSRYATLNAIWDAIREPLSANGLAITQTTDFNGAGNVFVLTTTLRHASGQWVSSIRPLPIGKPQEMGSAETYAKRYALSSIVGITADEDDDGNAATAGNGNGQKRQNPHVPNRPGEIITEADYDQYGDPIDNIPRGDERIEPMTKAHARPDFAKAQHEMRLTRTLGELDAWGKANANRIESYPADWQEDMRGLYKEHRQDLEAVRAGDLGIPDFLDRRGGPAK